MEQARCVRALMAFFDRRPRMAASVSCARRSLRERSIAPVRVGGCGSDSSASTSASCRHLDLAVVGAFYGRGKGGGPSARRCLLPSRTRIALPASVAAASAVATPTSLSSPRSSRPSAWMKSQDGCTQKSARRLLRSCRRAPGVRIRARRLPDPHRRMGKGAKAGSARLALLALHRALSRRQAA
jgi:hypothetical protein